MGYTLNEITLRTSNTADGMKKQTKYGKILQAASCRSCLTANTISDKEFLPFRGTAIMLPMKPENMTSVYWA